MEWSESIKQFTIQFKENKLFCFHLWLNVIVDWRTEWNGFQLSSIHCIHQSPSQREIDWMKWWACRRPEAVGAPFNQPQPIHFFSIHELNKFKKAEGRSSWLSWFHYLLIPFVCLNEGLFVDVRSLPRSVAAAAAPNRASNSSSQPTLHPSNTPREVKPRQSNKINFIFLLLIHSLGAALPQRER